MADFLMSLVSQLLLIIPVTIAFSLLHLLRKRTSFVTDFQTVKAETIVNLKLFLFNLLIVVPAISLVAATSIGFIESRDLIVFEAKKFNEIQPLLLLVFTVFAGDFIGYWRHRLEHCRWFWPSHAVHHSDTTMTWFSLERFHPINRLTTLVIDSSFLTIIGFPPYVVILNSLIRHYYGYFIHANLPWTYGRLGKIFVSPAMHRWHHSKDTASFNTNFATIFSIIDLAFGTYRVPGPCEAKLGVSHPMKRTFLGQISYAFKPSSYKRWSKS